MPLYQAQFPVGSQVRIASLERLEEFMTSWRYHNPLAAEQLAFAGQVVTVRDLGYYHGGDVLYELDGIPGTWHEQCLSAVEDKGAA